MNKGGNKMARITIFTPAYNAERTIYRTYDSLVKQTYKNFEWIVWNDGSTDKTHEILEKIIEEKKITIRYFKEKNQGKHIIYNKALVLSDSELFLNLDSDDALTDYALSVLIYYWDLIEDKTYYAGIKSRTLNFFNKSKINGKYFGKNDVYLDMSLFDFRYKKKYDKSEMHYLIRTEIAREFMCPNIKGIRFFPELITQLQISKKYITRFINIPTRIYYTNDSFLTSKNNKRNKELYFYWKYLINEIDYLWFYSFKDFIKSYIGIARDGKYSGYSFNKIKKEITKHKFMYFLLFPIGWILFKFGK